MAIKFPYKDKEGFHDRSGSWHDYSQCPGCGHNYFRGGSGLCRWCINDLKDKGKKLLFEEDTKLISCTPYIK